MSVQPSVASFFGKRKRLVTEEVSRQKLLKTNHSNVVPSNSQALDSNSESKYVDACDKHKNNENVVTDSLKNKKCSISSCSQTIKEKPKIQVDIREALKKCLEKPQIPTVVSPVKFQLMGSLSPAKKSTKKTPCRSNDDNEYMDNSEITNEKNDKSTCSNNPSVRNLDFSKTHNDYSTEDVIKSAKELVSKMKETQRKLSTENIKKKELSLKEIKDKINRSSKLTELKKSINKINQHAEELIELEKKKLTGSQPKLSKFPAFEITVPISPKKNALYSPSKHQGSCKPAYEQFAGLVNTISLPLPFGYQRLLELFCAVDTICSMITNRGEILTFNKLKPAVEEMTRKTFTARYLGQIAAVYPDAFTFSQEKLRNFGSTSKTDKYELVITPVIQKNQEGPSKKTVKEDDIFGLAEKKIMTPKVMKYRKEIFFSNLLERTKDYHEEFLKTLDPPITINRNELKRWHPNFMVDHVPDVVPEELPQPPNTEKPATAKQILDRAKDFLNSNLRLQKALEAAATCSSQSTDSAPAISLDVKEKIDSRLPNPLKGISKSLLEKVRAKQAAKALDAMRMSPAEEKETLVYMRLPDMARIVRTIFINEQKGVLPLEILLEKVQFSCNRNLGLKEVEVHIRLLAEILPEWLSIVNIRNVNYIKISRNVDVVSVMSKLKKIVEDKKVGKVINVKQMR